MREIINRIKQIENELKLREDNGKLKSYNTGEKVHHKQVDFHKCLKRNRWVFGGNRTGKTECGAVECIFMARGNHPYRKINGDTCGWVVSLSREVQRDVAQKKILSYLNPKWIKDVIVSSGKKDYLQSAVIDRIEIYNVFGGVSVIGFKSCDQGREKFQGTSLDYVWFDEEPPVDIYTECKMRVIDRRGDLFGTMTPLKGLTFVFDEIFLNKKNDDNVWYEFISWEENPFLDREEILSLSSTMSEDELESRKFGRFKENVGLVYTEFDENIHVIEPFNIPVEWQDALSIDPGLNNPTSCHFYAVDYDGNVYVVAEHYEKGQTVEHHSNRIKAIANRLNWKRDGAGNICSLIDSAANQRTLNANKSVSELFFESGINCNAKVNKDVFAGINRVKGYFKPICGNPKLFIFKNCVNLIRELKSYWWGDNDSPKKADDHALDELRYYIMSRPQAPKEREVVSEVRKHKNKLAREVNRNKKWKN